MKKLTSAALLAIFALSSNSSFATTDKNNTFKTYFTVDAKAHLPNEQKDPLEKLNRKIYTFNETLDKHIAKPIAVQYEQKIPEDIRSSYRLFRKNLGEPWNALNQLIQGKPLRAAKTLGRFGINTLTSLGFADPARRIGLDSSEESLGTTLGYYGVPTGAYLMLPLLGPSTIRDSLSLAVDSQAQGLKYITANQHDTLDLGITGLTAVDKRSGLLGIENTLPEDKYAAIRDLYLQKQAFDIAERKGESPDNAFIEDVVEESPADSDADIIE